MVVDLGDVVGVCDVGGEEGWDAVLKPEAVAVFEKVFDDGWVSEKTASGFAADVVDDADFFVEWGVAVKDGVAASGVVAVDVADVVKLDSGSGGNDFRGERFARPAATEKPESATRWGNRIRHVDFVFHLSTVALIHPGNRGEIDDFITVASIRNIQSGFPEFFQNKFFRSRKTFRRRVDVRRKTRRFLL